MKYQDPYRLHYHLMPPSGSLADPNGMCQIHDTYHIYYVHNPLACQTKERTACVWGHYSTKDFVHFKQEAIAIKPDHQCDRDGVYSGSSLYEDGELYVFYTGNVRYQGDYDYIYNGREQNVLMTSSQDAEVFTHKNVLMTNEDFPINMTKHVRDPQVFKEDCYYMVLGACNIENQGLILIYESQDKLHWNYLNQITTSKPFGFMWECPDLIMLNQQRILITCPQGIPQTDIYQNQHQCGYFEVIGDFRNKCSLSEFQLFDYGFDFYAARTFVNQKGERILFAWMGMSEASYGINMTYQDGWMQALAMPRVLTYHDHHIYQSPIEQMKDLRISHYQYDGQHQNTIHSLCFELIIEDIQSNISIQLREDCFIQYADSILSLTMGTCGDGRTKRQVKIESLNHLQIFSDTSSLEIFINHGYCTMTSRLFGIHDQCIIEPLIGTIHFYKLGAYRIQ